jgi:hypothetical protein
MAKPTTPPSGTPLQERSDISVTRVLRIAALAFVAAILIHVGAAVLLFRWRKHFVTAPSRWEKVRPPPPEPRLERRNGEALARVREREQRRLTGYGWVDRSAGVVRIPIDDAINLLLQRGLPARPAPEETP